MDKKGNDYLKKLITKFDFDYQVIGKLNEMPEQIYNSDDGSDILRKLGEYRKGIRQVPNLSFPPNKQQPLSSETLNQLQQLIGNYSNNSKFVDYLEAIARSNLNANLIFEWMIEIGIKQGVLYGLMGSYYEWNLNAFMQAIDIKMIQFPIGDYGHFSKETPQSIIQSLKDTSPSVIRMKAQTNNTPKKTDEELMQEFIDAL